MCESAVGVMGCLLCFVCLSPAFLTPSTQLQSPLLISLPIFYLWLLSLLSFLPVAIFLLPTRVT